MSLLWSHFFSFVSTLESGARFPTPHSLSNTFLRWRDLLHKPVANIFVVYSPSRASGYTPYMHILHHTSMKCSTSSFVPHHTISPSLMGSVRRMTHIHGSSCQGLGSYQICMVMPHVITFKTAWAPAVCPEPYESHPSTVKASEVLHLLLRKVQHVGIYCPPVAPCLYIQAHKLDTEDAGNSQRSYPTPAI